MSGLLLNNLKILSVFALCSLSGMAQAQEDALNLEIGGYMRGYVTYATQDSAPGISERHIDILRDTEIHFNGESKLDHGLTIGIHIEASTDMGDSFNVDKSYMYASGDWGHINLGGNNGAAYILQVVAPAADSNYDGMRQYVNGVNYNLAPAAFTGLATFDWEYAQDSSASSDKVTYLTPLYDGFQAGVSYAPDVQATAFAGNQESTAASRSLNGVNTDDVAGAYGNAWEVAARYEEKFNDVGLKLGAGYIRVAQENDAVLEDDLAAWNIAAAATYKKFGVGAVYTENNQGAEPDKDASILVLGADYAAGSWKFGTSWYSREDENFSGTTDLDTDRYSIGTTYTYGPGMTFRGSVHYIDHEVGTADMDATTFLIGSQVNF